MELTATLTVEDPTATGKKRLLFVDDEPNFLSGIRRLLRGQREIWDMEFAESVDEAIEAVNMRSFDTIISDVNMPIKSGLDLLETLRNDSRFASIPIIILTGNAEADLKRKALDLGATDLLSKPVTPEDLIARIQSVLRLKGYQDELRDQNAQLERRVLARTAELERAQRDIIWRLAKAGEYRDEETGDHVVRVACSCRALACALGLPGDQIGRIFLTSPLHDLGKIGVPDRVLLKRDKLTDEERLIMQQHCHIGASILLSQPEGAYAFLGPRPDSAKGRKLDIDMLHEMAATIIMSHHEKWDGSGYPNGLKGDAIPIAGQICAVADVYDALRSERPYKKSFDFEKTMEIMREGYGTHFSPEVYRVFESIVDEFEDIRKEFSS